MVLLLELKEKIKKFYNKYDRYIVPVIKFVMAFIAFCMLNMTIGYMTRIKSPIIAIGLSFICAFLPVGFTIFALSIFMLAHLYAISAEFTIIALCVVLLMYLFYFRLTPKQGYVLIITVVLCWLNVPYIIPVVMGLGVGALSMVPVSFGVIIYYIIKTASAYEAAIVNQSMSDSMKQLSYIAETFLNNKEWIILVIAFAVTIAVTYFIKRLTVDNAWTYAIIAGTAVQFIILVAGIVAFDANINLVFMIVGTILGALAGYICQVIFFSVDYKRTEYVQYEDDEYYYYVKAVPKINIANEELKVKQINARKTKKTNNVNRMSRASERHVVNTDDDEDDIYI